MTASFDLHTVLPPPHRFTTSTPSSRPANTSSSPCIREEGELNRSVNREEDGAVDANVGVLVDDDLSVDEDEDEDG